MEDGTGRNMQSWFYCILAGSVCRNYPDLLAEVLLLCKVGIKYEVVPVEMVTTK